MTDQVLKQQVHDYVESIWEDAVADIATLVAIRSVEDLDHAEKGKPYGPKPYEALSEAVRIASRFWDLTPTTSTVTLGMRTYLVQATDSLR